MLLATILLFFDAVAGQVIMSSVSARSQLAYSFNLSLPHLLANTASPSAVSEVRILNHLKNLHSEPSLSTSDFGVGLVRSLLVQPINFET